MASVFLSVLPESSVAQRDLLHNWPFILSAAKALLFATFDTRKALSMPSRAIVSDCHGSSRISRCIS